MSEMHYLSEEEEKAEKKANNCEVVGELKMRVCLTDGKFRQIRRNVGF